MQNSKLKITTKNSKLCFWLARAAFVVALVIFAKYVVFAQSTTNSAADQQTIDDKQEQIQDLEQKAETYRQMIEMNQSKAQTLSNQIKLMEGQIASLEIDIAEIQKKIDDTSQDIDTLSGQVEAREKDIEAQKKILGELLQAYYENDQDTIAELVLKNSSFSDFMNQTEYMSQMGARVDKILTSITDAKNQLESEKKQMEAKNEEQKERRGDISQKKISLDSEQSSKEQLLAETNGQEQKYQQLLSRVEEQKQELLGDISTLSEEKSSDLKAVEANIKKPKSGLASTSWYFSQRDTRWGNQHIGLSSTKMKNYGCAVTAVAMVLKYHGVNIDPGTLAQQPVFYHDLIVWPQAWKGVNLSSSTGHGNISWSVVDKEIKNGNPVIVFVKATKRGAGHYVVIHGKDKNGDYVVHDPYWGSNIFLSSTRAYVGALYDSPTTVDQMIVYH